jgi:hypothetical protein
MMGQQVGRLAVLWVAMWAAGCGGDDQDPEGARELLDRVRAEDYRSWERPPDYETRQPAASPHSNWVDIFINDVIADVLAAADPIDEWPLGSIIVKDGYTSGDNLELIALMEKREDGWFWAEFFGETSAYSGQPSVCIDCHRRGDDHVLAFGFPEP